MPRGDFAPMRSNNAERTLRPLWVISDRAIAAPGPTNVRCYTYTNSGQRCGATTDCPLCAMCGRLRVGKSFLQFLPPDVLEWALNKRTFCDAGAMSALPPIADIGSFSPVRQ